MSKLPPNACRLRVQYIKDGRLAYLGHLEVMSTVMRSIRRAGLPFEVGNGFAHRMRIQFNQALPVGASSAAEYFDLLLSEPIDAEAALAALKAASPKGLAPRKAEILPRRIPALEAWANLAVWEIEIREPGLDAERFMEAADRIREIGSIDFMRGDKPRHLELAPTLVSVAATTVEGGVDVEMRTRSGEGGSLRPQIFIEAALGVRPLRVCRVAQYHEEADGTLTAPL